MNNEIKERKRKPIPSKKKEGSEGNMIQKGKTKPIPTKKKKNMMMNEENKGSVDFKPYPEITSDSFYQEIYEKKEFRDHEIKHSDIHDEDACNPSEFRLSPFQSFLKNYISIDTPYNGILVMYSTGVGKTCAAISIAEGFKKTLKQMGKRILVLTTLRKNFENELFNFKKEDEMKKSADEIVQCTGKEYELPADFKFLSLKQKKYEVQKIIRSYYQFFGYQKFANYVMKMTNGWDGTEDKINDEIKRFIHREFDDRVIIIDEVHNIKTDVKNELDKAIQPILLSIMKYANNVKLVLMSATPMFDVPEEIIFILNLLLANDKRELVRKEDIFNRDGTLQPEAIELLSRLLKGYVSYARGEKPLQFPFRLYPEDAIIPQLEYYMSGKKIEEEKKIRFTKVVECEMESVQNATYLHFLNKKLKEGKIKQVSDMDVNEINEIIEDNETIINENNEEDGDETDVNENENKNINLKKLKLNVKSKKGKEKLNENKSQPKSILDALTYISTVVYPTTIKDNETEEEEEENMNTTSRKKDDENKLSLSRYGSFGKEGIDNNTDNGRGGYYKVSSIRDGLKTVQYKYQSHAIINNGKSSQAPFADEKYLDRYSAKFAKILEELKRAEGLCFVYSRYVDDGILPLALMLEQNGFERVTVKGETRLLDEPIASGSQWGKRPPICYKCGLTFKEGNHNKDVKGSHTFYRAKYILYFGESKDIIRTTKEMALEKFTSRTNKYGEEIKVFLGTRTVSEGLNFKRLRQVHILQPWFNLSRHEQIIGRAIRNCSHQDLPIEHRNVEIFQYACILNKNTKGVKKGMETVDLKYYRLAENKDRIIKKIMRLLKESAVDCNLFRKHNIITSNEKFKQITASGQELTVAVKDEPFSSMCDYEEDCEYRCSWSVNPHKEYPINTDTYNLRFATQDIATAKKYIKELFRHHNVYHLGDIENKIQELNPKMDRLFIYAGLDQYVNSPKSEMIVDKYGRKGYLIYRGDYYIFQPMGLKEDLPVLYRDKPSDYKPTEIRLEQEEFIYDDKGKKEMRVENVKNMEIGEVSRVGKTMKDELTFLGRVLNEIKIQYNYNKDKIRLNEDYKDEYKLAVIGSVLDKLKTSQYVYFMTILLTMYLRGELEKKNKEKNKNSLSEFIKYIMEYENVNMITYRDLTFGHENSTTISTKKKKKDDKKNNKKSLIVGFRYKDPAQPSIGEQYYVLKQLNRDLEFNMNGIDMDDIRFEKCNPEILRRIKQKEQLKIMMDDDSKKKLTYNEIYGILAYESNDYKFKIADKRKERGQKKATGEASQRAIVSGRVCSTYPVKDISEIRGALNLGEWKTSKRGDLCNNIEIYLRYQQEIQKKIGTNKIYFIRDV